MVGEVMLARFTTDELDILRHLVEPQKPTSVVLSVIAERYDLPERVHQAIKHGWKPPDQWHRNERARLAAAARSLLDHKWLDTGPLWELSLKLCELEIIALQAMTPYGSNKGRAVTSPADASS
jgi:hypothetical protein